MNTLGKVLVFLNLLFSLIVGALIIMVFVTRTQWQSGYKDLSGRLTKEHDNFLAAVDARNKVEAAKNAELAKVDGDLKEVTAKLNIASASETKAKNDLQAEKIAHDTSRATLKKMEAAEANRETEVKNLDLRLTESVKKVEDLLVSTKKLADRAITAEIERDSAKQRNDKLVEQYQAMLKQLEEFRIGESGKNNSVVKNPPPEDVKGLIKAYDATSGLVTINLGSDSGLNRGNTLEAFRTKPTPVYLGVLKIVDVRPTEAVGKIIGRGGRLQVGDEVASEIISRR